MQMILNKKYNATQFQKKVGQVKSGILVGSGRCQTTYPWDFT